MSKRCSYVDRSKSPNVPCGYLAADGSQRQYCPRHELLVPALEAEKGKKAMTRLKRSLQPKARR